MVSLQRLLLAADGSPASDQAACFAGRLASRFAGRVEVLSVVPERSVVTTAWLGMAPEMPVAALGADSALEQASRVSQAAASEVKRGGCGEVGWSVEIGEPARTIVSVADSLDADAIVMGRRGTGNISGLLLGSVSTKVCHLTDRTVITVRGEDAEIERVLVAVDGSDHSARAVDVGIALAGAYRASLDLLHVVSMTALVPFGLGGVDNYEYGRLEDTMRTEGEQYLLEASKMAEAADIEATTSIELGDPASHIVRHAFNTKADLICVGRRGLGNVKGLLLGSVSHKVAHIAEQTVVTVR
jgi:nucleotide-binding universal stress UspA family protein